MEKKTKEEFCEDMLKLIDADLKLADYIDIYDPENKNFKIPLPKLLSSVEKDVEEINIKQKINEKEVYKLGVSLKSFLSASINYISEQLKDKDTFDIFLKNIDIKNQSKENIEMLSHMSIIGVLLNGMKNGKEPEKELNEAQTIKLIEKITKTIEELGKDPTKLNFDNLNKFLEITTGGIKHEDITKALKKKPEIINDLTERKDPRKFY